MALLFNADAENVTHGGNLVDPDNWSVGGWARIASVDGSAHRHFVTQNVTGGMLRIIASVSANGLNSQVFGASPGTNINSITDDGLNVADAWSFYFWTFDSANTDPVPQLHQYLGFLDAAVIDRSVNTSFGFGALATSSGDLRFSGAISSDDGDIDGEMAIVYCWPTTTLTGLQVEELRLGIIPTVAGCQLYSQYAPHAGIAATDWSGNNNDGVVDLATDAGVHVPLPRINNRPKFRYEDAVAAASVPELSGWQGSAIPPAPQVLEVVSY